MGGRPLRNTLGAGKRALIHQRLMELLAEVRRLVFDTVAPGKIIELFNVGRDGAAPGIPTVEVVAGSSRSSASRACAPTGVVRAAIARGVETGLFGYATARPPLGEDGRYRLDRSRIAFERAVAADEIDLDSGFLILPAALPKPRRSASAGRPDRDRGRRRHAGADAARDRRHRRRSPPTRRRRYRNRRRSR